MNFFYVPGIFIIAAAIFVVVFPTWDIILEKLLIRKSNPKIQNRFKLLKK